MAVTCLFCDQDVTNNGDFRPSHTLYVCKRCGFVQLTREAADDFAGGRFTEQDKLAISITLRNEWERSGRRPSDRKLTLSDLTKIAFQYKRLDAIDKMDDALIKFDKLSNYVGASITIDPENDYPFYHCDKSSELESIGDLLSEQDLISISPVTRHPLNDFSITARGYQRLRELKKLGQNSKQCFVAMWFTPEMNDVFEKAIKPAIEFKDKGAETSRFEAVKIDNVEHVNDINDEIIAQIRRSRFMVCDLTGYRGGVYFEAGFAYGLGLDVIYTCREDWTKEGSLKDKQGKEGKIVKFLYDDMDNKVEVKKEGVHFDLAHRNRIEWSPSNLPDFKEKLENRIKAVIY